MGIYTFTLEQFHIDNTRSRNDDTDTVQFGFAAGRRSFGSQSHDAGDVDNGDHVVGLSFSSVVLADAATPAVINYQIYNGNTGHFEGGLAAISDRLSGKALDFFVDAAQPGNQVTELNYLDVGQTTPDNFDAADFNDASWFDFVRLIRIGSFFFPDCDGFVAVGTVGMNKLGWDRAIDAAGGATFRKTIRYPGSDSNAGCGSNSDYTVTWSVTRQRANGPSLRGFLREHGLGAPAGLRALGPDARMSVRQLMT
ncbi:hypothetical protein F3087_07180 [Nocardia colli]|uniref:Uncharacterized protein n=1 Tax=Nocardia colli TaxID=2545717 RepID=A0A5N0EN06_9NOCA|nr:hypothetical protein [Nocardia colli]KAA8888791.1 hypothetical protein F3087_07180 [Nocardia colli]